MALLPFWCLFHKFLIENYSISFDEYLLLSESSNRPPLLKPSSCFSGYSHYIHTPQMPPAYPYASKPIYTPPYSQSLYPLICTLCNCCNPPQLKVAKMVLLLFSQPTSPNQSFWTKNGSLLTQFHGNQAWPKVCVGSIDWQNQHFLLTSQMEEFRPTELVWPIFFTWFPFYFVLYKVSKINEKNTFPIINS